MKIIIYKLHTNLGQETALDGLRKMWILFYSKNFYYEQNIFIHVDVKNMSKW